MSHNISNTKTALITGASRGIGLGIAKELAKHGYDLILTCHTQTDKLQTLKEELSRDYPVKILCHTGDIADEEFCSQIFSQIDSLDVLINNAGMSHMGLLQDMTNEEWHRLLNVNLDSVFYTTKRAIPLMLKNKRGSIINISSMWGTVGASFEVAYSATKGAINAFTKALAKELAPSGIQVNAIAPGVIDTDMNAHLDQHDKQTLINDIPADRFGTPNDIARAVISIINAGSYMTGQIIGVDGGYI